MSQLSEYLIAVALVAFLFLIFAFSAQLSCHFCIPGDKFKWNFNVLKSGSKLYIVIYLSFKKPSTRFWVTG